MRTIVASIEGEYRRYQGLGERALRQLDGEGLARRVPASGGNSAAIVVWHLGGNLESRFTDFLTADGEKEWRDRESEFAARLPYRDVTGRNAGAWRLISTSRSASSGLA